MSSTNPVQFGQAASHSGGYMMWYTTSWCRPSNRSTSLTGPPAPVNAYGASFAVLDGDGWVVGKVGAVVVLGGGSAGPERAHAVSPTGRARIFAVAGAHGLHY